MRIAAIGDVHGCVDEFRQLVSVLEWQSLDEIWTLGDLVDRGPDSAGAIQLCLDKNIKSVMGNHDQSIINHYDTLQKTGNLPKNLDKKITLAQLKPHHINYLKGCPNLHVNDELGLILVHGGVWPHLPLYAQPGNVIRAQMIHPKIFGKNRWWGPDAAMGAKDGKTEEESRAEGWERWYRLYDFKEDILFGHSTWYQPMVYESKTGGKCIGVDTGSCFGGSVTACIYDSSKEFHFISVKAKKTYYASTTRSYWEE